MTAIPPGRSLTLSPETEAQEANMILIPMIGYLIRAWRRRRAVRLATT
jgi:hypothetical protein